MHKTLLELYAELRSITPKASELRKAVAAAGDAATAEQRSELTDALIKITEIRSEIDAAQENELIDSALAKGQINERSFADTSGKRKSEEYRKAFNNYLRMGHQNLSNEDKKTLSEFRALNTAGNNEGGFIVDTITNTTIQEEQYTWGELYARSRKVKTQGGQPIQWPVSSEGLTRGVIIGEAQNHGKSTTGFTSRTMGAHKMSSQIILVSDELLQDSYIDVAAYVTRIARQRVELGINWYMMNGVGGANEPESLLMQIPTARKMNVTLAADASVNVKAAAVYDALIDLTTFVDPAYRRMSSYGVAMNDYTLNLVRHWKDADGKPIYVNDVSKDWPETIFGRPLILDNSMPDFTGTAAGNGAIVAGDFNALVTRLAGDMVVKRFDELYGETGQVGFLAWQRFGLVLEQTAAFSAVVFDGTGTNAPLRPTISLPTQDPAGVGLQTGYGTNGEADPATGVVPGAPVVTAPEVEGAAATTQSTTSGFGDA